MNEQEVVQILNKVGAVIVNSHIVYSAGKHGATYVNKYAIYPHTIETSQICRAIARQFVNDNVKTVIAPTMGGVILSQWTAYHLTNMNSREIFGVYAEKDKKELVSSSYGPLPPKYEDRFVIKSGYDKFITGKNVLVVEDVLNTGKSAKSVIEAVRAIGGNVVGLGVICNRGKITTKDVANVPKLIALVNANLEEWDESICPLCKQNIPINTDVGHGRDFLRRKRT